MANRVRCYFDIEINHVASGRVVFELFSDVCPKTCENFRALCVGDRGIGETTNKPLYYKGVKFHRVIKDFMIQAGDFSSENGKGGESVYGGQFEDENFDLKHDAPFLLSMANKGKDTNGSQFFITTQTASHLDGKHVVFGRVVSGQEIVEAVENLPVDNRSKPLQPAEIVNCGELVKQVAVSSKVKEKKKKKRKNSDHSDDDRKKKKHKSRKEKSDEEGELSDTVVQEQENVRPHVLSAVFAINPQEIPEVPRNRFLDRGPQDRDDDDFQTDSRGRMRSQANVQSTRFYTRSGRKVKGRGSLRYRTPSRSRSRSVTPPHWKQAQKKTISLERFQVIAKREQEREKEMEERRKKRELRHKEKEFGRQRINYENVFESKVEHDNHVDEDRPPKRLKKDDLRNKLQERRSSPLNGQGKDNEDEDEDIEMNTLDYEASEDEVEESPKDRKKFVSEREKNIKKEYSPGRDRSPKRRYNSKSSRNDSRYDRRRRSRSRDRRRRRSRTRSRDRKHKRSRSRERRHRRSRTRSRSRDRRRRSRSRNVSKERKRSKSRDSSSKVQRSRSREPTRDRKRSRSREPSRDKKRSRSRDASRDRKRSRSRDASTDRKRSRSRDASRDRKRSKSRDSSRDRKRSKSRDNSSDRKRSRSSDTSEDRSKSRERKSNRSH